MHVTYIERAPGVWRLRIEQHRSADGKRQFSYETVRGSEEIAKRRCFEIQRQHEEGSWAKPDKLTLGAFLERWMEQRQAIGTICRGSAETYAKLLRKHVIAHLGGLRLQRVAGHDIQGLYTQMLKGGLSPASALLVHRIFKAAMADARKARLIIVNPMDEVQAPRARGPRGANKAIDTEGVNKLLRAVEGTWKEDIVRFALGTGLRRGEICGLRWRDVNLADARVAVTGQLVSYDDGEHERKEPKTENGRRRVSLSAPIVDILRARRATAAADSMAAGRGSIEDGFVFTRDGVRPMSPDALTDMIRKMCDRIGLPDFTFHGLRHTHITDLLRNGGRAKAVSERAGHSSVAFTMGVYQSVFEEDDRRLAEMSEGLVKKRGL